LAHELTTLHRIGVAPGVDIQARILPLPSPDFVSSMLRRDLDRVRLALASPHESREQVIQQAMTALPRARRLAGLLESLVPILSEAASSTSGEDRRVKAKQATVDALPTHIFDGTPLKATHQSDCYICLDEYCPGERCRRLPCGHWFHASCVDRWLLDVHCTCPCCRRTVGGEDPTRPAQRRTTEPRTPLRTNVLPDSFNVLSSSYPLSNLVGETASRSLRELQRALRPRHASEASLPGSPPTESLVGMVNPDSAGAEALLESLISDGDPDQAPQSGHASRTRVARGAALSVSQRAEQSAASAAGADLEASLVELRTLQARRGALQGEHNRLAAEQRGLGDQRLALQRELAALRRARRLAEGVAGEEGQPGDLADADAAAPQISDLVDRAGGREQTRWLQGGRARGRDLGGDQQRRHLNEARVGPDTIRAVAGSLGGRRRTPQLRMVPARRALEARRAKHGGEAAGAVLTTAAPRRGAGVGQSGRFVGGSWRYGALSAAR